jgi:hypothetical protein
MPKKVKTNSNGHLPTAKELLEKYPLPKKLSKEQKELLEATREAMQALDERIKKYGYPPDFRH